MSNYKCFKKEVELYQLRSSVNFEGWSNIYVNVSGEESGELVINSDYGSWAYYWSCCGMPFKNFLIKVGKEYLLHKLNGNYEDKINWEKTKEAIINSVNEYHKQLLDDDVFEENDENYNPNSNDQIKNGIEEELKILNNFFEENWESPDLLYHLIHEGDVGYWNLFSEVFGSDLDAIPFVKEYDYGLMDFVEKVWPVFIEQLKTEI